MFYYAIILTVGNEMAPTRLDQNFFVAGITIFGSLFMAFLFGSIAATVQSMSSKESYYADQLDNVQNNMIAIKLEERIQDDVIKYLELI
jgi:hypothetical protein